MDSSGKKSGKKRKRSESSDLEDYQPKKHHREEDEDEDFELPKRKKHKKHHRHRKSSDRDPALIKKPGNLASERTEETSSKSKKEESKQEFHPASSDEEVESESPRKHKKDKKEKAKTKSSSKSSVSGTDRWELLEQTTKAHFEEAFTREGKKIKQNMQRYIQAQEKQNNLALKQSIDEFNSTFSKEEHQTTDSAVNQKGNEKSLPSGNMPVERFVEQKEQEVVESQNTELVRNDEERVIEMKPPTTIRKERKMKEMQESTSTEEKTKSMGKNKNEPKISLYALQLQTMKTQSANHDSKSSPLVKRKEKEPCPITIRGVPTIISYEVESKQVLSLHDFALHFNSVLTNGPGAPTYATSAVCHTSTAFESHMQLNDPRIPQSKLHNINPNSFSLTAMNADGTESESISSILPKQNFKPPDGSKFQSHQIRQLYLSFMAEKTPYYDQLYEVGKLNPMCRDDIPEIDVEHVRRMMIEPVAPFKSCVMREHCFTTYLNEGNSFVGMSYLSMEEYDRYLTVGPSALPQKRGYCYACLVQLFNFLVDLNRNHGHLCNRIKFPFKHKVNAVGGYLPSAMIQTPTGYTDGLNVPFRQIDLSDYVLTEAKILVKVQNGDSKSCFVKKTVRAYEEKPTLLFLKGSSNLEIPSVKPYFYVNTYLEEKFTTEFLLRQSFSVPDNCRAYLSQIASANGNEAASKLADGIENAIFGYKSNVRIRRRRGYAFVKDTNDTSADCVDESIPEIDAAYKLVDPDNGPWDRDHNDCGPLLPQDVKLVYLSSSWDRLKHITDNIQVEDHYQRIIKDEIPFETYEDMFAAQNAEENDIQFFNRLIFHPPAKLKKLDENSLDDYFPAHSFPLIRPVKPQEENGIEQRPVIKYGPKTREAKEEFLESFYAFLKYKYTSRPLDLLFADSIEVTAANIYYLLAMFGFLIRFSSPETTQKYCSEYFKTPNFEPFNASNYDHSSENFVNGVKYPVFQLHDNTVLSELHVFKNRIYHALHLRINVSRMIIEICQEKGNQMSDHEKILSRKLLLFIEGHMPLVTFFVHAMTPESQRINSSSNDNLPQFVKPSIKPDSSNCDVENVTDDESDEDEDFTDHKKTPSATTNKSVDITLCPSDVELEAVPAEAQILQTNGTYADYLVPEWKCWRKIMKPQVPMYLEPEDLKELKITTKRVFLDPPRVVIKRMLKDKRLAKDFPFLQELFDKIPKSVLFAEFKDSYKALKKSWLKHGSEFMCNLMEGCKGFLYWFPFTKPDNQGPCIGNEPFLTPTHSILVTMLMRINASSLMVEYFKVFIDKYTALQKPSDPNTQETKPDSNEAEIKTENNSTESIDTSLASEGVFAPSTKKAMLSSERASALMTKPGDLASEHEEIQYFKDLEVEYIDHLKELCYQLRLFSQTHLELALFIAETKSLSDDLILDEKYYPEIKISPYIIFYPFDTSCFHEGDLDSTAKFYSYINFIAHNNTQNQAWFYLNSKVAPRCCHRRKFDVKQDIACTQSPNYYKWWLTCVYVSMTGNYRHCNYWPSFQRCLQLFKYLFKQHTDEIKASFMNMQINRSFLTSSIMREHMKFQLGYNPSFYHSICEAFPQWPDFETSVISEMDIARAIYDKTGQVKEIDERIRVTLGTPVDVYRCSNRTFVDFLIIRIRDYYQDVAKYRKTKKTNKQKSKDGKTNGKTGKPAGNGGEDEFYNSLQYKAPYEQWELQRQLNVNMINTVQSLSPEEQKHVEQYVATLEPLSDIVLSDFKYLGMSQAGIDIVWSCYDLFVKEENKRSVLTLLGSMNPHDFELLWYIMRTIKTYYSLCVLPTPRSLALEQERAIRRKYNIPAHLPLPKPTYSVVYSMICCSNRKTPVSQEVGTKFYGHTRCTLKSDSKQYFCSAKPAKKTSSKKKKTGKNKENEDGEDDDENMLTTDQYGNFIINAEDNNNPNENNEGEEDDYGLGIGNNPGNAGYSFLRELKEQNAQQDVTRKKLLSNYKKVCQESKIITVPAVGNFIQHNDRKEKEDPQTVTICPKCGSTTLFSVSMYNINGFSCGICNQEELASFEQPICDGCKTLKKTNRSTWEQILMFDDDPQKGTFQMCYFHFCTECTRRTFKKGFSVMTRSEANILITKQVRVKTDQEHELELWRSWKQPNDDFNNSKPKKRKPQICA